MQADSKPCPVCAANSFEPTDKGVDVDEVMRRWEEFLKSTLPSTVRHKYNSEVYPSIRLWQCQSCGFGAFHPPCAGDGEFYETINQSEYYVPDKWEFNQAVADIDRLGVKRVLDVGCGSGEFLDRLRRERPSLRIAGYDVAERTVEALRERGFEMISGARDELGSYSHRTEPFDMVCMFQVLEHVADPIGFLGAFAPFLRPGGWLVVTTPNEEGPIQHFWKALTEIPPHHVTKWTERSFRHLFSRPPWRFLARRIEPLPRNLWQSYLPVMWSDGIWPSMMFDAVARSRGRVELLDRVSFAIECLVSAGVTELHEVPGHTIYVLAQRS